MISSQFYVFDTESIDFGAFHCLDRPVCGCVVITAEALIELTESGFEVVDASGSALGSQTNCQVACVGINAAKL